MKKAVALLIGVALACSAGAAFANQFPPGPSGTCLDSLTIPQTQDSTLLCHAVRPDTVRGVRGVITGFDAIPSGFAFYIQTRDGAAWSGVQVFTGSFNYNASVPGSPTGGNLLIGDSVSVGGRLQEFPAPSGTFDGTTELEGYDDVQSTNDIDIRLISRGNPIAPFFIGTTNQFNWVPGKEPLITANRRFAEQYEGCLVKIRGPLQVARRSVTGSLVVGMPNNTLLAFKVGSPADSVLVDYGTLAGGVPPAVGATIDSVQGILNEGSTNTIFSYRVQIRNSSDVFDAVPANLLDAFPVQDNQLLLKFDAPLTKASAESIAYYSLSSFGSVLSAAQQTDPHFVLLTINNGLSDGDPEGVTVNGVQRSDNLKRITTPQSLTFINGVLSAAEVQAPNPDSLSGGTMCQDRSRYAGTGSSTGPRMSIRAIALGRFGNLYNLGDPGNPQRGGIAIFAPPTGLLPNHQYLIAGNVQEFFQETEVTTISYVQDEGFAGNYYPGLSITCATMNDTLCDAAQNQLTAEDFEGQLVTIQSAMITDTASAGKSFHVATPNPNAPAGSTRLAAGFTDTTFISNATNGISSFVPVPGHIITVSGLVHYSGPDYVIRPRDDNDIHDHGPNVGVPPGTPKQVTFAIYPNPAHDAQVSFGLPQKSNVELGVYDVAGRIVATLTHGTMDPGTYSRTWNGMDGNGHAAGAGMYFIRLKVNGETRTLRAVHLD